MCRQLAFERLFLQTPQLKENMTDIWGKKPKVLSASGDYWIAKEIFLFVLLYFKQKNRSEHGAGKIGKVPQRDTEAHTPRTNAMLLNRRTTNSICFTFQDMLDTSQRYHIADTHTCAMHLWAHSVSSFGPQEIVLNKNQVHHYKHVFVKLQIYK